MGKKIWLSMHPRNFNRDLLSRDRTPARPSTPEVYQCKITQSTGMATQMQLEVILAGNRIATRVF